MSENFVNDILEDISNNPIDWVIHKTWGPFDGIRSVKKNVVISGYNGSLNRFMTLIELSFDGCEMPLKYTSTIRLYLAINEWTKHVPAAHLLGDIALIKKDEEEPELNLIT